MNKAHLAKQGVDSELEARIASYELGFVPISPADLHATLLHALGLDQHRVIYSYNTTRSPPPSAAKSCARCLPEVAILLRRDEHSADKNKPRFRT